MLHDAAFCIFLMSNAAFSDASFPNLRYNSAVERDNGIAGPVFDDSSNERGLVRVCGYLGAVLCAGMGVGLLSSV